MRSHKLARRRCIKQDLQEMKRRQFQLLTTEQIGPSVGLKAPDPEWCDIRTMSIGDVLMGIKVERGVVGASASGEIGRGEPLYRLHTGSGSIGVKFIY